MTKMTKQKDSKVYKITLDLGNKVLIGKGTTALEALRQIKKPVKLISKGVMTISYGKLKKELLFMPAKLKRIFYPNAQPVLIKWLSAGLK